MLRPKEVCERLGISYATLREYVKRGPWKLIQRRLSEKTLLVKVSLKNTSPNLPAMRVCLKDPSGQGIQVPEVRVRDDRQKLASINIYLRYTKMRGTFPQRWPPDTWMKGAVGWGHPKRAEPSDMDPDERGLRER